VKLSERQLAIKVQRDEEVLARPLHCRCFRHVTRLPKVRTMASEKVLASLGVPGQVYLPDYDN
jgi:hypothetical protein